MAEIYSQYHPNFEQYKSLIDGKQDAIRERMGKIDTLVSEIAEISKDFENTKFILETGQIWKTVNV